MKIKLLCLFLVCVAIIGVSCEKDKDDMPKTYPVAGLWVGTYTVTQMPAQAPLQQVFSIKPDGKITAEGVGADGKRYFSQGTWTLNGTAFTATYATINFTGFEVTQTATLTFDNSGKMTNGTWTDNTNSSGTVNSGTFPEMSRVN